MKSGEEKVSKILAKSCPQESVLGSTLWSVATEQLVKQRYPEYTEYFIYADDVAVLISPDNRKDLKARVLCDNGKTP